MTEWMPMEAEGGRDPRTTLRFQSLALMMGLPLTRGPMGGTSHGKDAGLHYGHAGLIVLTQAPAEKVWLRSKSGPRSEAQLSFVSLAMIPKVTKQSGLPRRVGWEVINEQPWACSVPHTSLVRPAYHFNIFEPMFKNQASSFKNINFWLLLENQKIWQHGLETSESNHC